MHDFRSDTVTRPTAEMYDAMREAPLGDDVFRDDPTVLALEAETAKLLGTEAALFVPTGTMANAIGVGLSARPGNEVILLEDGHTYLFEAGGVSRLWGAHPRPLAAPEGCPTPAAVEAAVRRDDPHFPRTSLVCLENTHNMQGGKVIAPARFAEISAMCRRHGLRLHLDGARLLNAAVALGLPAADLTRGADTVSLCFSKGLGCPAGSAIAGTARDMQEALRLRKLLGGGMRQAGILAACGLVALQNGFAHLADDHRRARALAEGLAALPGVTVTPKRVETNIVFVEVRGSDPARYRQLDEALRARGVWAVNIMDRRIRFVTHRDIGDGAIEAAIDAVAKLAREGI
ncbi:MAG: aminotransferase class I/II-fold pyridoxal phosphate-dependent enzyme [Planctomycetes bacterium]|nr:aminotransferase class I/II-fold pyridoxal phosphate-dependent enzyme [Planctomycetota bacterium]